jgi:predicted nucleic acid-binding protein
LARKPFSKEASRESAKVSAELKKSGKQIGIADLLIAGICIYTGSCLLTKNIDHFRRITELQVLELVQL